MQFMALAIFCEDWEEAAWLLYLAPVVNLPRRGAVLITDRRPSPLVKGNPMR